MGENPDHALAFDDVHAPHHAVLLPGQVDGAHVGSGDAGMVGYVREEQEDGAEEPREGLMAVEGIEGDFAGDGGGAGIVVAPGIGSQLTLSFQGEVYVFDAVTPEKVQSVLLLLGGRELTSGVVGSPPPSSYQYNGRLNLPQRVASLMRFREKRKERNFGKKIRYDVRKEVALRMQRHRGQFAPSNQKSDAAGVDATNWDTPQNWGSVEMPLVQSASECHHCGVSAESTPMMRRGPDGPRTLCNACGLMWATKGALKDLSRSSTSADPSKKVLTLHEPDSLIKCGETAATDEPNPNLSANGHGHPL